MQIIVLGMHRSGTSLVASMLNKMGVNMGQNIIPPDENNPHGYFEDNDFLHLNKAILASVGGDWKHFATSKQIVASAPEFDKKIKDLIQSKSKSKLWGFKDPRTCLTCWLYHQYLRNPGYVVVHRSLPGLIKSLNNAYGDGPWKELAGHYYEHVDNFIRLRNLDKIYHVAYDDLIGNAHQRHIAAMGLAQFIGRPLMAQEALRLIRK